MADGVKFCSECGAKIEINIDGVVTPEVEDSVPINERKSDDIATKVTEAIPTITETVAGLSDKMTKKAAAFSNSVSRKASSKITEAIPSISEKVSDFSDRVTKKANELGDTASKKTSSPGNNGRAKKEKASKGNKTVFFGLAFAVLILILLISSIGGRSTSSNTPTKTTVDNSTTDSAIVMINVTEMDYPSAVKALRDAGFTNITSNVSGDTDEALWIVTEQSVSAGKQASADSKISLTCAMKCNLYLDITSEANLIFSTYDIAIFLDGEEIGSVGNGKEFTYLIEVLSGKHELLFSKSGDTSVKGTKKLTVSGDLTYTCTLSHDSSSVSMKNETTESNISKATLEVVDVTGMVLSDAISTLGDIGFSNLREEPFNSIWDKDNWIVVSQGITAGTIADKNEYFQLDCISLDDYFSQTYVGKNATEIQEHAEKSGFSIRFEDSSGKDLNNTIANLDGDTMKDWVATSARQYGGADKTAVVKMEYTGVVPETTVPETSEAKEETPSRQSESSASVSYSTNSKDTVKNGNTGVYSYKSRGGSYDIYYIIDFDEGYVYYFCDGNGDGTCDRIKIDSGTLNDVVIITYHDGGDTWQEGLHFKWVRQPDHLIMEDHNHFEYDFYTTNLNSALAIRNTKNIHNY